MKKLVILLLLICSVSAIAQRFKRFDNSKCNIVHKCDVKRAFNNYKNTAYTYKSAEFGLTAPNHVGEKPLEVSIMKVFDADKNAMMVIMFSGKLKDCSDQTSYVSLLLKSGDRVTLPCLSKSPDCHSNYMMTGLSESDVNIIASSEITRVRLHYKNLEEDFTVDKNCQQNFMDNFQCISGIEKK